MAVALDADQEALVHFSFPIEKQEDTAEINPIDGTPDVLIWGKATDGTVDADRQIVDPEWSAAALKEWVATGGNVRMSHDPKRPVGKGQEVQVTMDGHYVKSLICDPLAKHFIRNGVLNDYSVGISAPHIKYGPDKALDPRGSATGGIITGRPDGQSKIAELSVVDRGSNFNSKFQITRKSAGEDVEFTGKMIGDEDEITKAAPPALLTKAIAPAPPAAMDAWTPPEDLSITFTPNDMARMLQQKFVDKHYAELAQQAAVEKRDFDRNVGGGVDRDKLDDSDFAGKNRSFPIVTQSDVGDALQSIGRAGDDNYDAATLRANIHRIARRKGFSVPGDDSSKGAENVQVTEEPVAEKEAEPDLVKDPEGEPEVKDAPVKKGKKKAKGGKKLPPWLNKPADDSDADDDDSADKAAHCTEAHEHTEKCHTPPSVAAGVTAVHMDPAPVPASLPESDPVPSTVSKGGATPASASGAIAPPMDPVPAHREPDGAPMEAFEASAKMSDGDDEAPTRLEAEMKVAELSPDPEVAAIMRFKAAGIGDELGRLHDLTCPAYHPDAVAKYHPFADFANAIDLDGFQRQAMKAAAGGDLSHAKAMQEVLYAAAALKTADAGFLNDCRLALHKAFRDANPGPSSAPTPGSICASSFNRPLVTEGHEASSAGHDGPNTSPQVANSAPNAHSFDRPPLSAGHQSPSPSHMKASFEYPAEQGVPTRLNYATMEKERARQALVAVHEHLSRQFPEACPISLDGPQQPTSRPVPPTAGIGKGGGGGEFATGGLVKATLETGEYIVPKSAIPAIAAAFKATPEDGDLFGDADIYKSFKKMRKKLGKKVLSGKMTVDEARSRLGRQFAQKGSDEEAETVQKSALSNAAFGADGSVIVLPPARKSAAPAAPPAPVAASFGPSDIEAAVTKAVTPLLEKIREQDEAFTTKLAEQQRVIDAIADQPDPSTAAFSGLAYNPAVQKARRPAAVPDQAEYAARAQDMVRRNLTHTYTTHSSPAVREAAGEALAKLGSETP